MKKFTEILLYIWQLPQNLVGLFLLLWYQHEKVYHRLNGRTFYFTTEMPSGISLGNYIIMNRQDKEDGMRHEYGHSIDSRRWGPIYLLVIGLPSILGNIYDRIFHKKWKYSDSCEWYYNQPWEKSADKNGKVDRKAYIEQLRRLGY
jgi:hypothetical protein